MKATKSGNRTVTVHAEYFTSMGEAVRMVKSRPSKVENPHDQFFQNYAWPSDPKWSGFTSPAELDELCSNGLTDISAVQDVLKYAGQAMVQEKDKLVKKCMDVAGGAVDVPLFLSGSPECMMGLKRKKVKSRIVKATVNCEVLCNISSWEYIQAGRVISRAVASLEKAGYRVRLVANCGLWNCGSEAALMSVVIKRENEPCNYRRLLYPLMSPSFFRGLGFNWACTLPEYKTGWGLGQRLDMAFNDNVKEEAFDQLTRKVCGEGFVRFSINDIIRLNNKNPIETSEKFLRAQLLDLEA